MVHNIHDNSAIRPLNLAFPDNRAARNRLSYGPGAWEKTLIGFRSLPPAITIYSLAITPLTAGVCEELIWGGYL